MSREAVHVRLQVGASAGAVALGLLAAGAPLLWEAEGTRLVWWVSTLLLAMLLCAQGASLILARLGPAERVNDAPAPIDFDAAWRGGPR